MRQEWFKRLSVYSRRNLARAVKARRAQLGITIKSLAERAGLDRAVVTNLEKGDSDIELASLRKISEVLGVPVSELVRTYDTHAISFGPPASISIRLADLVPPCPDRQLSAFSLTLEKGYQDAEFKLQEKDLLLVIHSGKVSVVYESGEVLVEGSMYVKGGTLYKLISLEDSRIFLVVAGRISGPICD